MKKLLLALACSVGLGLSAQAQPVNVGDVAPNFTLTDINNVSHNLYSYLDSGYTVIIDVSATWCGPCWTMHNSHVFRDLTTHYGPGGTITPRKIKVIFIEGDASTTSADLNGQTPGTQGNWVTGTNYPIIDNATQNGNYLYGGFPSFTVICRDRLVAFKAAGYSQAMLTEAFWLNIANQDCPNYGPSATVDAKAVAYNGKNHFVCTANPTVKFQNYSQSQNITSATIKVMSGSTQVATTNWTGTLAPYAVATVNVPTFTPTMSQPFKYEVTVAGDSNAPNNVSDDSLFRVYLPSQAVSVPYLQNFTTPPATLSSSGILFITDTVFFSNNTNKPVIQANGTIGNAVAFDFYDTDAGETIELFLGGFNNASATNSSLEFDYAAAQYNNPLSNDKLDVMVSNDCGANWTSVWSKTGAALATVPATASLYVPTAAAQWAHAGVSVTANKGTNMMVKFVGLSDFGNVAWIDNVKISNTTGINDVIAANSIALAPNPAIDVCQISLQLLQATEVAVSVVDAMGKVVMQVPAKAYSAGAQRISLNTSSLAGGIYQVRISTEQGTSTQKLTIAK